MAGGLEGQQGGQREVDGVDDAEAVPRHTPASPAAGPALQRLRPAARARRELAGRGAASRTPGWTRALRRYGADCERRVSEWAGWQQTAAGVGGRGGVDTL